MLTGIVGLICSGKSEASDYLRKQMHFYKLAFGEEVRLEANKRGLPLTRESLQRLGEEMESQVSGYWSRRLLERVEEGKNYVVDGFRYPSQIKIFKQVPDFRLLGITAPDDLREKRYNFRNRGEGIDFKNADNNDRFYMQRTDDCICMAEEIFTNNGNLLQLHRWLESKIGVVKC